MHKKRDNKYIQCIMSGTGMKKSGNSKYYEILGVPKSVSPDELKKAYHKALINNHPEIKGDLDKLRKKEVVNAYKVLSDPEKSELYDKYGDEDSLQGSSGTSPGFFNWITSFFGGDGTSSKDKTEKRGEDFLLPVNMSLEDFYRGTTKKFSLSRNLICSKCCGKGSKAGASTRCVTCQGLGIIESGLYIPREPRFLFRCNTCTGTGHVITDTNRCLQCKGNKVMLEKKVLEVVVEKGMPDGHEIIFLGEADEAPDTVTGDIVCILQQTDHPKFKRKGQNLFYEHTLSFIEAVGAFKGFILTHLDGRQIFVKEDPGEVIKHDELKAIDGEGMPIYQTPLTKGNLYIHFKVGFPDSLRPDQVTALESILPSMLLTDEELNECEKTMHNVNNDEEVRMRWAQAQLVSYDEDDKEPDKVSDIRLREYSKLKGKDDDLFYEHTLSLTEAFCGFRFVLTHLDRRQLLVRSNPGEVIKPDSFKVINNEGISIYERPLMKGKLYIHFTVDIPESLSRYQAKALDDIIQSPKPSMQLTDMEQRECKETTLSK